MKCSRQARFLFWTEDSRLVGVVDDDFYSYYAYGHDGERALKLAGKNSQMDVNAGTYTCQALLDDATLYPSPYLVASRKGYTKHYYAGTERLCARIGDGGLDRFGTFQCTDTALSNRARWLFKDCNSAMLSRQLQANDGPSVEAVCGKTPIELQEKVKDVPVHVDATVSFDLSDFRKAMSNYAGHLQPYGEETFYYHGDHLGSASWITDKNGIPVQHLQYLPFGEPYVSQHAAGGYEERFTFTAKERDQETGYGYFGARYMDPDLSALWLSVDPMADKYPSISPYAYCAWNPVKLVDPDGREIGDYYDKNGNYKGWDGVLDNRVYIVDDKASLAKDKKGNIDASRVEPLVSTTYETLNAIVGVFNRTIDKENRGSKEESTATLAGLINIPGAPGYTGADGKPHCNFPKLTEEQKMLGVTSIHSHLFVTAENSYYPATPSVDDKELFSSCGMNIIVGYISAPTQISAYPNSTENIGAAFINSSNKTVATMSMRAVEKIIGNRQKEKEKHFNQILKGL